MKFSIKEQNTKIIASALLIGLVIISIIYIPNWDNEDKWYDDPDEKEPYMSVIYPLKDILNYNTSFPPYDIPNLNYTPRIVPSILESELSNVNFQGYSLSPAIISQLEQYGFALVGNSGQTLREIYDYEDNLKPKFITADFCLHTYHKIYDHQLKKIETDFFANYFTYLLKSIQYHQLSLIEDDMDLKIESAIKQNIAYVSVMLCLLDDSNSIPEIVNSAVNEELAKINSKSPTYSSIFGYIEDYSQYIPRGHYTESELLEKYFMAMMYAGRMTFILNDSQNPQMGIEHTRSALILLDSIEVAIKNFTGWHCWEHINSITGMFIGDSDDLTPLEYYQIWKEFDFPNATELVNDNLVENIIEKLHKFRKPKINSMIVADDLEFEKETQGMRLFGQKFIPDSYIFQELAHPKVQYRTIPSGLDIFSVFGNKIAENHLQSENTTYPEYNSQITALKEYFTNLTDEDWTENLYSSWIYSLQSLIRNNYTGFPGFMQNYAWENKALMGMMGSWAELRHDTILYAKQSYSGYWGDYTPPWKIGGYVEPNPETYARLAALSYQTFQGLYERGMYASYFIDLSIIFQNLTSISIKELENIPLSSDDYNFIDTVGQDMLDICVANENEEDENINRMGIIADVHTDPNTFLCLEVGTGDPLIIYAIVQDTNGNLRLTKGATYSYYEFNHSMYDRLTDEKWLEMLDGNDPPLMPSWITSNIPIVFL
ncbi:DUF3160 domain-containing protein [Promethearchaeum syntrophicum]|uniref:DUF3160 domain-containing protein n=1 Tax=Promethearchaeum syntrophicum TaxID=2594042 RepID=A0A5B9D912_9ARCH|nr:DUF3160 domain-containing protein [Candidatus Prometheoarchaeum syntrophicum]QEE15495.1 hypothetical protein DSAG12_01321 [Candidatus Prometheoarchaeum syntrophicum]